MTNVITHPAPHRNKVSFWALMFGCCAAPLLWIGQLTLGYWVTAQICYGSDHPTLTDAPGTLYSTLIVFDVIAIAVGILGGIVSLMSWNATQEEKKGGAYHALSIGEGRARFMALWGIMSSVWFLGAIIFNTIGSTMVPICAR
ncbi:MAG TPA: hypothetical protein VGT78_01265 [Rhizomicrobium sp.]|nr:hypothetical protein [Rhizomicrobium sp.]